MILASLDRVFACRGDVRHRRMAPDIAGVAGRHCRTFAATSPATLPAAA